MPQINVGTLPDDGTGDTLRQAGLKINQYGQLNDKTVNAAFYKTGGLTTEAALNLAIPVAAALGTGAAVWIPQSLFPYTPSAVTYNTAVILLREGAPPGVYDVKAYGALGTATGNDGVAINAASSAASANSGGIVYFPRGNYRTTQLLTYNTGVIFQGEAYNISSGQTAVVIINAVAAGFAIGPPAGGPFNGVQITNIKILNDTSVNPGASGLDFTGCNSSIVFNVMVHSLDGVTTSTGEGFRIALSAGQGGLYNEIHNLNVQRCTWGVRMFGGGAVNLNWFYNFRCGNCVTGMEIVGSHNVFISPDVEIATTGFTIAAGGGTGHHMFMSPHLEVMTTGFNDAGESGSWIIGPHFAGVTTKMVGGFLSTMLETNTKWGNNDLTYGVTVAIDAIGAKYYRLVVTNGVGFTMQNPTNGLDGQELVFEIFNNSGGVMGAITWDTQFSLAGAFTNPLSTKRRMIHFMRYGGSWREVARAAADL